MSKLIQIKPTFARHNNLPVVFVVEVLVTTARAIKVYGRGIDSGSLGWGICSVCGRTLTQELSVDSGIGPVCAKRLGIDRNRSIKEQFESFTVDTWLPKSVVVRSEDSDIQVEVPASAKAAPKRKVSRVYAETSRDIHLKFSYDAELVRRVKEIAGRRYDPQRKTWIVPSGQTAWRFIEEYGFKSII